VKLKVRDTLCPAASAAGRLGDVNAKYLLEMAAELMLTVAFPEFVALSVRVLRIPGATLPKFKAKLPKKGSLAEQEGRHLPLGSLRSKQWQKRAGFLQLLSE